MPGRYENNSPAMRFLTRGSELARLQKRVITQMMSDTQAEHEAVKGTTISTGTDVKQFMRDTMARLEKSKERFAEIELMFQIFFCRHIDNFQIFIEELIRDAARKDQGLLNSIKLRKADAALPADDQFENRIEKLSRLSVRELEEMLEVEMNFRLFSTTEASVRVSYLYDLRNLMTHSYGVVDKHFLTKHPKSGVSLGQRIKVEPEFMKETVETLVAAAGEIQKRAEERFGLSYKTSVREPQWWEK